MSIQTEPGGCTRSMPGLHGLSRYALLVDIGNTRLKWCLHDAQTAKGQTWLPQGDGSCAGSVSSDSWDLPGATTLATDWAAVLRQLGLSGRDVCLFAARVGPHPWEAVLERIARQLDMPLQWVRSTGTFGLLTNSYDEPHTLGVDRFLSALATVHSFPGRPAVIVTVGTATTVDAVDATAHFLGGCILPGPALMAASLHQNTADLPQVQADWSPFPRNTRVAIASGIVRAQVGAVVGMLQQLAQDCGQQPLLVLSGGGRIWIDRAVWPGLAHGECVECDNLVLQGLAWWVRSQGVTV